MIRQDKDRPKLFMILKKENNGLPFTLIYISVIGFEMPCIIFSPSKKASCLYNQHEIDKIIPILKKNNIDFKIVKYSGS